MEIGVSDERLHELFLGARAVYYGPFDEDYGYVTIEGMAAERPVVTLRDSGGPLEFVTDGVTGFVAEPDPKAIAETLRPAGRRRRARRAPGPGGQRARPRGRADLAAGRGAAARLMRSPLRRARRAVNDRLSAPRTIERVASLGPVPPAPTGIATYHQAVLDGLERIGFTRDLPVEPIWPVRDQDFATLPGYRMRIYQLGNNADFHLPIYRMVWQAPGLIVLHDLAFDDFVRGLQTSGDRLGFVAIREALEARELRDAARRQSESAACASRGWPRPRVARAGSWCTPSSAVATWNRSAVARRSSWSRIRRWNPRRRSRAPRRPGRGCARPPKRAAPARWWSRPAM